jgi:hypothetical protein
MQGRLCGYVRLALLASLSVDRAEMNISLSISLRPCLKTIQTLNCFFSVAVNLSVETDGLCLSMTIFALSALISSRPHRTTLFPLRSVADFEMVYSRSDCIAREGVFISAVALKKHTDGETG